MGGAVHTLPGSASVPVYHPIDRAVVERVPGGRLVALDGCRQSAPITDPQPVAAAILDAIAAAGISTHLEIHP